MKLLLEYKNWIKNIKNKFIFNSHEDKIKVFHVETYGDNIIEGDALNYVFSNDIQIMGYKKGAINIGFFNVKRYGRIYLNLDPEEKCEEYVDNSFFFQGGFMIREEYQKLGFGKKLITEIFEHVPQLENIILYAEENVGKPFWINIGAEIIKTFNSLEEYDNNGLNYFEYFHIDSGDLHLLILKRNKFV